jgi:hypothetical protein
MSEDQDLGGILNRAMSGTCASCGASLPPRSNACGACGAAVEDDDEESYSYMSEEPKAAPSVGKYTPLEQSKNYLKLQEAATVVDGAIDDARFLEIVTRLKHVGGSGVQLFETDMAHKKFGHLQGEEREQVDRMYRGFKQLRDGVMRMEQYLSTRDATDIAEGCAVANAGFVDIDQAQYRALQIAEEQRDA